MPAESSDESGDATITDDDQARIDAVLGFWFREPELSAPQIDGRMDIWFGEDPLFDRRIRDEFLGDVANASDGKYDHWTGSPEGTLALILLLDQFRRNIYRGTAEAYACDKKALKLCVEGAVRKGDRGLSAIQRVFFYMPLQHAESRKVQARSVSIYRKLADSVSKTYEETFQTICQFAELHHDIVEQFGRFPHRNKTLDRKNTPEEEEYLAGDAPDFGQS